MGKLIGAVAATLMLGAALSLTGPALDSLAQQATPRSSPPVVISSEVLGRATPIAVENPELALGRVTIMPGAVIPVHHHPGTQIGVVVQGVLSYAVHTGEVVWQHGSDPSAAPTIIHAGETVSVLPGDALVESPDSLHQGWNDGNVPVVIFLSTLFPAGAPRAILAEATPTP